MLWNAGVDNASISFVIRSPFAVGWIQMWTRTLRAAAKSGNYQWDDHVVSLLNMVGSGAIFMIEYFYFRESFVGQFS